MSCDVMTTSRRVASHTGKAHRHFLRTFDNLDCSEDFCRHNFVPTEYVDSHGRVQREIRMTKDGFMFLVMWFTEKMRSLSTSAVPVRCAMAVMTNGHPCIDIAPGDRRGTNLAPRLP